MTTIQIVIAIAALICGSLGTHFIKEYQASRGKVEIGKYNVSLIYVPFNFQNYFNKILVNIQFVNLSGNQKVFQNLKASFHFYSDGEESIIELKFDGSKLEPSYVSLPKKVDIVSYELRSVVPWTQPINIIGNDYYIDFEYTVGNKSYSDKINRGDIELKKFVSVQEMDI